MSKKIWTYDLETYANFFCGVFAQGDELKIFEVSFRKNDLHELVKFYKTKISYAMGFNNLNFDAQVMHYICTEFEKVYDEHSENSAIWIYKFAQELITQLSETNFAKYPMWDLEVEQIDLFKINHYNNKNKRTSLKWLEFSMDWDKVQDLPINHTEFIHDDKTADDIIEYCINDVMATREFGQRCKDLVKLRIQQDAQYPGLWLLNKSDSSVGETMFLHLMAEEMGVERRDLKKLQTHRTTGLEVKDILLPYINFKTPEFQKVLDFYKSAWSGGITFTQHYQGINYEYGEGGLHASMTDSWIKADDKYAIIDVDVASFYPNLAIVNNFKPEHLGEAFSKVFKGIYNERKKYPKGTAENASYKIILNGSYGKMGDEYSFLLDHKPRLEICINGQLLLTMLAERFSLIPDTTIIQANTDGVTIKILRDNIDKAMDICRRWEKLTGLELEDVYYKQMIISNVNNYIAEYENGNVKHKGLLYDVNPELHKNKSQRIVQIALHEYFINGVPVEDTIKNHVNIEPNTGYMYDEKKGTYGIPVKRGIFDYCIGKKVRGKQSYVFQTLNGEEEIQEKVIRYYVSKRGKPMMKKFEDGRVHAVSKSQQCMLFMDYLPSDDYGIDFEYYINEAYKIITPIEGGNPKIGYQQKLEF